MTQPLLLAMPDSEFAPVTEDAVVGVVPDQETQDRREKQAEKIRRSTTAELLFCLKAVELGYEVKWMQGQCKGYDIILERTGMRPMFVQVKSSGPQAGRSDYYIRNSSEGVIYNAAAYDVLAVYLYDRNEWVFYTRSELGNRTSTSYTPAEFRQYAAKSCACDARDPNNWNLLDEVAESLTANQKPFVA